MVAVVVLVLLALRQHQIASAVMVAMEPLHFLRGGW
jgi:hypothetical protein